MMTKEQFERVQPLEEHLIEAKGGSCRSFLMRDAMILNEVYAELTGHGENMTCGKCVLTMLRLLAAEYDKYIEEQKKIAPAPLKTQNKGTTKKKGTRK